MLAIAATGAPACGGDSAGDEERAEIERRFGRRADTAAVGGADAAAGAGEAERSGGAGFREGDPAAARGGADTDHPPGAVEGAPPRRDSAESAGAGAAAVAEDAERGALPPSGRAIPGPGPSGAGRQEPDPLILLAAADTAYRFLPSLRAGFAQRMEVPLLDRVTEGVGVWYQEGRDRFRMDFTDPPDDAFVADGTHLWLYQPSSQPSQVIRCELAGGAAEAGTADLLGRILSEARTDYDAVYEAVEAVSGERAHRIALTPLGPSDYRLVRVWIGDSDRLVRRFRIEHENENIRTVTLSRLEPGVPLADSLFRFVAPAGVETFEC